jgi:hypothetical protein
MEVSPSELRKNIYNLLDQVLETGVPLEIKRKGKKLKIIPSDPVSKFAKLDGHPDCIVGDPEELVHLDWSDNWNPNI